jgi:hypothetical protein
MSKLTKCTTPLQLKHVLEFGFEIVELEEKGNTPVVIGVRSLFCMYNGRDVGSTTRKHNSAANIHIFKAPFIKQHYLSHLKQHAETWEEYNELSINDEKVYFISKVKCVNTMHMYINTNQDAIHFIISLPVVNTIIKELFYCDDEVDEEDHHMNMFLVSLERS